MNTRRARSMLAATLTAMVLVVGACSSDDGGTDTAAVDTEAPAPDAANSDAGQGADGDTDADDAPSSDDAELDAIAFGLRVSLQAERVEVEGNTVHIYIEPTDRVVAGAGSECIVATRVVPEGTTVILHRDGTETTC